MGVYPRLFSWALNAIIMVFMKEEDHTLPHTPAHPGEKEAEIGVSEVMSKRSLFQPGRAGNGSLRGSGGSLSPLTP